jgi:hypothetical protein
MPVALETPTQLLSGIVEDLVDRVVVGGRDRSTAPGVPPELYGDLEDRESVCPAAACRGFRRIRSDRGQSRRTTRYVRAPLTSRKNGRMASASCSGYA